ncbi:MAG: hypothetical protein AAFZ09_14955, partial [Pseudomonadota bacterium]
RKMHELYRVSWLDEDERKEVGMVMDALRRLKGGKPPRNRSAITMLELQQLTGTLAGSEAARAVSGGAPPARGRAAAGSPASARDGQAGRSGQAGSVMAPGLAPRRRCGNRSAVSPRPG